MGKLLKSITKQTNYKVHDRVMLVGFKLRIPGTIINAPKKDDIGIIVEVIPASGIKVKRYAIKFQKFGRAIIPADDLTLILVKRPPRMVLSNTYLTKTEAEKHAKNFRENIGWDSTVRRTKDGWGVFYARFPTEKDKPRINRRSLRITPKTPRLKR